MIWRRIRPTVVLAVLGLIVLGLAGMYWKIDTVSGAAVGGLISIAKDIVSSEDKVTEHEAKNGGMPE